jgi:ATP-dependent helicase YprA (DUF1998 family)
MGEDRNQWSRGAVTALGFCKFGLCQRRDHQRHGRAGRSASMVIQVCIKSYPLDQYLVKKLVFKLVMTFALK